MRIWSVALRALLASVFGVATGCTGAPPPNAFVGIPATATQHRAPLDHSDVHRSWISSDAAKRSLLYISDAENGVVDIYKNFGSKTVALVGQLTGLRYPAGECVDRNGNVWITEFYGQDAMEYAHGGTTRLQTLAVAGFPSGCSVDPTSGNLAVVSWEGVPSYNSPGAVFVFAHASGTPRLYTDPHLFQYFPPGYDSNGNLFVQGYNPKVALDELPRGGSALQEISLGVGIWSPGGVMWDGKYVAADDQQYQGGSTTAIYRISVTGTKGTVVGTSVLTDSCDPSGNHADVMQPWIHNSTILGGNHFCTHRFAFWNYPSGGNPTRVLPANIAPLDPIGETISP